MKRAFRLGVHISCQEFDYSYNAVVAIVNYSLPKNPKSLGFVHGLCSPSKDTYSHVPRIEGT